MLRSKLALKERKESKEVSGQSVAGETQNFFVADVLARQSV